MTVYTDDTRMTDVEHDETLSLIASNKVEGTPVYDRDGERVGSVYNFMVDKRSGKVAYAVMSFGGFLGIGDSYHPLPWESLTFDPSLGGYRVDIERSRLETGPSYRGGEDPWSQREYGRQVSDYYGVGAAF